ncbi:hypothetical protein KBY96_06305 [Cyanobium sp. ATX 6A2]|uniref:hypothetical protein n=1 Tax=Cyanobium sp. ATX 6A2 TaxID=2823700 RepID=UPI0020CBE99A|nr:hypothetical protein [Cyanobium sp. ATX 6A2]MCP9887546.1 hypothetical protein [Cyanobium sp. ATX 6A2]
MTVPPQLAWEELERQLRAEDPQIWYQRLKTLETNRFNQHQMLLDRFATGSELKALFRLARRDANAHPGFQPWRQKAKQFSPSYGSATARFRRRVHRGRHHEILHYQGAPLPGTDPCPRPVLIGFTGNVGLLMAPTPYILSALGIIGHDLLLVRRHTLEGYFHHEGQVLRDISRHLRQRLETLARRGLCRSQVQSLGTSAGGLAALAVAQRLALAQGVAIGAGGGPETFRPGGPVQRAHSGIGSWWPRSQRTPLVLAYPEHNDTDRVSAGWVANYYQQKHPRQTTISGRAYRGCTNHTLFKDLIQQGVTLEDALPGLLRRGPWADTAAKHTDPLARKVGAAELQAGRMVAGENV